MFDIDNWQEILHSLGNNKLRTFLTAFGVFWGILMLIVLLGVGKGIENATEQAFSNDDKRSVWVSAGRTAVPYKGMPHNRKIQFTNEDIAAIRRQIPDVQYISAENFTGPHWNPRILISYQEQAARFEVYGVTKEYFNIKLHQDYPEGRPLNGLDQLEQRKVAVIGTAVRDRLYRGKGSPIGTYISINGMSLKVVGVFYDSGENGRMSERIYMPMSTSQATFGDMNELDTLAFTPKEGVDSFVLEKQVTDLLRARHKIAPHDRRALRVYNFAEQMQAFVEQNLAVNAFIWFVGIGTLAAGIVGVSNIMIITVKDRTREIGVRKALGASPYSIVSMILAESVIITAVAGYIGLVMGIAILEGIEWVMAIFNLDTSFFVNPEVNIGDAFSAVIVLVISGALAGLTPALQASKIMPIEAMREE